MFLLGLVTGVIIFILGFLVGIKAEKVFLLLKTQGRTTPKFEGKNGLLSYKNIHGTLNEEDI